MHDQASDRPTLARRSALAPGRDQVMLGALAAPLSPDAGPEFIRDTTVQAPGWYWKPAGASAWQWLGRNTVRAATVLAELRARAGR